MNSGMLFSVTQTIDTYVYRGLMERKYRYVVCVRSLSVTGRIYSCDVG